MRRFQGGVISTAAIFVAAAALAGVSSAPASASVPVVRVVGHELVDASGLPLRLIGVDRSGTEYACVQGWGIFDGPSDATSVTAIRSWHSDAVRVPLNEDCWLGINGISTTDGGTAYQQAIEKYVTTLNAAGIVAILDLHWNAPGTTKATGQQVMADADHSVSFWSSVAMAFRSDPSVVFDLYNEPHDISWSCWRNGCTVAAGWRSAGMQQMLTAVRQAGATQPVMVAGLNWAGDLSGWLANEPTDPLHQLVASAHIYNFSQCNTVSCWNQTVAPVARSVPVVTGEIGENDCAGSFINAYMNWADGIGVSYLGWAWDTANCNSGPSLISSYGGTPTAYGNAFRSHLAVLAAVSPDFAPLGSSSSGTGLDFTNGATNAWRVAWGSDAAVLAGPTGLALKLTGTGYPGFSGTQGLTGLAPGRSITYEIDNTSAVPIQIVPFAQDGSWSVHFVAPTSLAPGWHAVSWVVPPQSGLNAIGVQVNDSTNWSGQLVLAHIAW